MGDTLKELEDEWASWMQPTYVNRQGHEKKTVAEIWREQNPGEYQALLAYREGGPKPQLASSMGQQMVEHVEAWLTEKDTEQTPPPETADDGLIYIPREWNGGDRREPSSFPGYTYIKATDRLSLQNLDYKDYFIDLSTVSWSSIASGRSSFPIKGGRRKIIVGGEVLFNSTNPSDDCAGIHLLGGDNQSMLYIEGVRIQSVNGVTYQSPQKSYWQHCHRKARVFEDKDIPQHGGAGAHPDEFQIWDGGSEFSEIYEYRCTGYTWFTGKSTLLRQPIRWRRTKCDLHFGKRVYDAQQLGNYMLYLSGGNEQPTVKYDGGDDNWMDLGYWGGIREQLQMAIDSPTWTWKLAYVIRHNGQDYAGTDPNQYKSSNPAVGATQGDQWRCTSHSNITERWNWGKNPDYPNGEYATWDDCGPDYEPIPLSANMLEI